MYVLIARKSTTTTTTTPGLVTLYLLAGLLSFLMHAHALRGNCALFVDRGAVARPPAPACGSGLGFRFRVETLNPKLACSCCGVRVHHAYLHAGARSPLSVRSLRLPPFLCNPCARPVSLSPCQHRPLPLTLVWFCWRSRRPQCLDAPHKNCQERYVFILHARFHGSVVCLSACLWASCHCCSSTQLQTSHSPTFCKE